MSTPAVATLVVVVSDGGQNLVALRVFFPHYSNTCPGVKTINHYIHARDISWVVEGRRGKNGQSEREDKKRDLFLNRAGVASGHQVQKLILSLFKEKRMVGRGRVVVTINVLVYDTVLIHQFVVV